MKSQNTKSSDELKREVHQEIRNVKRDIDDMTGSVSPGRLLDRAIFARHGNSIRASIDHLKNNPIGATFLSLGTLLLMEDEYNETYETRLRNRFVDAYGLAKMHKADVTDRVVDIKDDVRMRTEGLKTKVSGVTEKIKGKVDEIRSRRAEEDVSTDTNDLHGVHAKVSEFKDRVQGAQGQLSDKVDDIRTSVSGKVDQLQSKITDVKDQITDKFQSSPSDYENWTSSETAPKMQKVKDKFGNMKEHIGSGYEAGREKVNSVFQSSRDRISNMDPVSYMALGAGLGVLTGAALPVTEAERTFVHDKLDDRMATFNSDLREAVNECSNILKDLVIQDAKNFNLNLF